MSILIKGMEMPKSCDNCWALDDYGDYPRCRITEEQRGYTFPIRQKRMDNCPLVPVPPHGRCIDADALVDKHFGKEFLSRVMTADEDDLGTALVNVPLVINNAPTIIEAEEGE